MKIKLKEKIKRISVEYKFGDFFRNFIAVILGIVITFAGSDYISERNTQKEVEKSLMLVKSELMLNRKEMKSMGETVSFEQNAARYLFQYKNRINEISPDSARMYTPTLFQWNKFEFISDAMEMLKSSALIQKIKNKELSLQIIKVYGTIKSAENIFDIYMNYKTQSQDKFNANPKVRAFIYQLTRKREKTDDRFEDNYMMEELKLLYSQPEGLQLIHSLPNIHNPRVYFHCVEEIDKTIAAIKKEYE